MTVIVCTYRYIGGMSYSDALQFLAARLLYGCRSFLDLSLKLSILG